MGPGRHREVGIDIAAVEQMGAGQQITYGSIVHDCRSHDAVRRGGRTRRVNVALACLHCNAHKWAYSDGEDPVPGERVAPFNPRTQRWEEHFQWSVHRSFAIVGISTHGRTTVVRLQMSHPNLVSIRCLLAALGISWKVEAYRDRGSRNCSTPIRQSLDRYPLRA